MGRAALTEEPLGFEQRLKGKLKLTSTETLAFQLLFFLPFTIVMC